MRVVGRLLGVVLLIACSASSTPTTTPSPRPHPDGGSGGDGGGGGIDAGGGGGGIDAGGGGGGIDAGGGGGGIDAGGGGGGIDAGGGTPGCDSLLRPPMHPYSTMHPGQPWHRCGGFGSGSALQIHVAANGSRAVVVTDAGDAFVVSLPSLSLVAAFTHANNRVSFAGLSADGSMLATVDDPHGEVAVWNVDSHSLLRVLGRSGAWPSLYELGDIEFSPDGTRLAAISLRYIDEWDLATGGAEPISQRSDIGGGMRILWAGNTRLVVGRFQYFGNGPYAGWGNVDMMDADTGANTVRLPYMFGSSLASIAVAGDGLLVAISGATTQPVAVFRTSDGSAAPAAAMNGMPLAMSSDGSEIALHESAAITVRRVADGTLVHSVPIAAQPHMEPTVTDDLATALVGDVPPDVVTAIALASGVQEGLACGEGGSAQITNVEVSRDGAHLVTTDATGAQRVWNVGSGALESIAPAADLVAPSNVSTDGTMTATPDATYPRELDITNNATGAQIEQIGSHPTAITHLEWSNDDTRIVSSAERDPADRSIVVPGVRSWLVSTGAMEQPIDAVDDAPALFAPGDQQLFVGDIGATNLWCR